ncbi:MAG: HD domain-containing protein [Cyclobacteriaceae bacterium]
MNKRKIINDPLYGLITIPSELIFDLIEEPFFQRLRRIKQLGLTEFVYPGANHTRFHHAIGAMHLMSRALDTLRQKGIDIDKQEYEASLVAILLHDIGHGPFSHSLEHNLLHQVKHEEVSLKIIKYLNQKYAGALSLAIRIFKNEYQRKFFHQLVSGQLDVDRLDYLSRDSFFTGVSEGTVGVDRIIKLIQVYKDQLVVEEKGIYSLENFLSARRLMYWQVYFHKTTVGIEKLLVQMIRRAKFLCRNGEEIPASHALLTFLAKEVDLNDIANNVELIQAFQKLDDFDIWAAIKTWADHPDKILSILSQMILYRRLFKVKITSKQPPKEELTNLRYQLKNQIKLPAEAAEYLILNGSMSNAAYISGGQRINVLTKDGKIEDIARISDLPNIKAMRKIVKKFYLCWPKSLSL